MERVAGWKCFNVWKASVMQADCNQFGVYSTKMDEVVGLRERPKGRTGPNKLWQLNVLFKIQ